MTTFICRRIFKDADTMQLGTDYVVVDAYSKGPACEVAGNEDTTYETQGMELVSVEVIAEDPPQVNGW